MSVPSRGLKLVEASAADLAADPFDRVLAALRRSGCRVRMRGSESARCSCPTHSDAKPSLVVTRRADRVLLKCFAGCRTGDVIKAIGVRLPELFTGRRAIHVPPEIAAVYCYTDVAGTILAEKVRFTPKGFRWRRPDALGRDGWAWNLGTTSPGLYNLAALVDERQVVIVEGEKAVDALMARGVIATCPPAGASRWDPTWAETLWRLGCVEVDILPDADQAGRLHAERVAASCCDVRGVTETESTDPGLLVKVVPLPDLPSAGDVVDWLASGHDVAALRRAVAEAPFWSPGSLERARGQRRRAQSRERMRRKRARDRANRDARPTARYAPNVRANTGTRLLRCERKQRPVTRYAVTQGERTSVHVTNQNCTRKEQQRVA